MKREGDGDFAAMAKERTVELPAISLKEDDFTDYCTETLAQIYADQGYPDQAKQIYSRLSLRFPEKSAYFAALIEKLKN